MNNDTQLALLHHFVEEMALMLETEGLPRMYGRVFGYLLVCEPRHQTSAELADALHASRGAISTATRALVKASLIRPKRIQGSRATYFEIPDDAADQLLRGSIARIAIFRRVIDNGLELVQKDENRDPRRMLGMKRVYEFMEAEFPKLLERWDAQKEEMS